MTTEADLHRFAIGQTLHEQYVAMQEEFSRGMKISGGGYIKFPYSEMMIMSQMALAQARGFPNVLKGYLAETFKLNLIYGDPDKKGWEFLTTEAMKRKELIENLLYDLGPTRVDERPEAPERQVYSYAYSYDGRKLVFDMFRKRLSENRNLVILFSGKVGGGKSYASLSVADFLTPELNVGYDLSALVYSIEEFIGQVRERKPGEVIILDEAGISAGSRDAMTKEAKTLGKVIQSIRYLKHCTIFTLPNANFLDKQARLMIDVVFEHEADQRQGEFMVKIPEISDDGKDTTYTDYTIGETIIRSVYFPLPRPYLIKDYEEKRKTHNMKQLADLQKALKPKEEDEAKKTGRGKNINSLKNLRNYKMEEEENE